MYVRGKDDILTRILSRKDLGMATELKRTPLYEAHVALGARMVDFAGYLMPVQYPNGTRIEHGAVRNAVGVFDVSHMGRVNITGRDAFRFANYFTTNNVDLLAEGQAQYSLLCNEQGGIEDDLIVYHAGDHVRVVVNAGNRRKDLDLMRGYASDFDVQIDDVTDDTVLLAVQGPNSPTILEKLGVEMSRLPYMYFQDRELLGIPTMIARTGYTGERGYELWLPAESAKLMWERLVTEGVEPCGLGARDILRLEVGYPLHGHEITTSTNPYEAGLGWVVKPGKGNFVGKDALKGIRERGVARQLIGFQLTAGGGVPREHMGVLYGGKRVGQTTSGTMSLSLNKGIGTAYVPTELSAVGTRLMINLREDGGGRNVPAEVVKTPFYKKGTARD